MDLLRLLKPEIMQGLSYWHDLVYLSLLFSAIVEKYWRGGLTGLLWRVE